MFNTPALALSAKEKVPAVVELAGSRTNGALIVSVLYDALPVRLSVIEPPLLSRSEFPPLAPEPPIVNEPVELPENERLPIFWLVESIETVTPVLLLNTAVLPLFVTVVEPGATPPDQFVPVPQLPLEVASQVCARVGAGSIRMAAATKLERYLATFI